MAYTATSFSFGEQPSAAKWNQLGSNDAYFDSLVGSGTAWASWTPSFTNLTKGNATITAVYQQFGKTVFGYIKVVFGTTTTVDGSNPTFSLPVTARAGYNAFHPIGYGGTSADSSGSSTKVLAITSASTTTAYFNCYDATLSYVTEAALTATVPHTFATNYIISGFFIYEAA